MPIMILSPVSNFGDHPLCITTHFDSVISVKQYDLEREIVTIFVVDINECDQIMTLTIQAVYTSM